MLNFFFLSFTQIFTHWERLNILQVFRQNNTSLKILQEKSPKKVQKKFKKRRRLSSHGTIGYVNKQDDPNYSSICLVSRLRGNSAIIDDRLDVQRQYIFEGGCFGSTSSTSRAAASFFSIRRHREKYRYKGVDGKVRNPALVAIQREVGHVDEIFLLEKEGCLWCVIYGNWTTWVKKTIKGWLKYSPALSKSTQFGILLSNHWRGFAVPEPPEPPKAFAFFLGVTGVFTTSER